MKKKKKPTEADVLAMVAKIMNQSGSPLELLNLDQDAELEHDHLEMMMEPLEIDFDALPPSPVRSAAGKPAVTVTGTRKITIRIPNRILASCRAKAARTGTKYQTVIIRTLNAASRDWDT